MWMTVTGVRTRRPAAPATVLLTDRARSVVLPIDVDDATALEVARAYRRGVSAGGLDLLMAVVAACGARLHHLALDREPGSDGSSRRRLHAADLTASMLLTDERRVELSAGEALALATRSGTPVAVPSSLRAPLIRVEPGVSDALARNAVEDAVDALRILLEHTQASDFGHPA